jgi:type IV pilus assembly protein PilW
MVLNFHSQTSSSRPLSHQSGLSLIELLVGLVISMIVTLVIMQAFSVFEGQKRTTSGTADAQTNGNIALYNVQRDVQLAGFGLPVYVKTNTPLLCTAFTPLGSNVSPVIITDGGGAAGASDSITVRYGSTPSGGVPVVIKGAITPSATNPAPAVMVGVDNNMGCQVGDTAMISSGTSCVLTQVIGPSDIAIPAVASAPPDSTHVELKDGTGVALGASISCMGSWNSFTYAVNNNQLERNGAPTVTEIVNIQAQYGVSAAGSSNQITEWVDASGATWGAAMTVADRNRIKAIRVAIVARNGLLEKEDVTTACSSLTDADPTGLCAWGGSAANPAPTIDISDIPDWERYRYRVFETIIPIRSMIWAWQAL